jgi:DNA-binding transcriptional MerR regulator
VEKAPDAFRTISEVAADLNVPQHVLRFWESRFREIKPMKRGGGRRYYRPDDVDLLRGIRHLLYGEGYTIRGVQRILKEQGLRFVQSVWQPGAPKPAQRPDESDFAIEDAEASQQAEADRGRGLFSLLPSLLGGKYDDEEPAERPEPPAIQQEAPPRVLPSQRLVPPLVAPRALPLEDMRKLESALRELTECRKLLDAALAVKI